MTAFRRAWLTLIAIGVLLFAFGSFTAAVACAASCPHRQDHSDCVGHDEMRTCAAVCNSLCSAAPSAFPVADGQYASPPAPFWHAAQSLEQFGSGPDPPPPRPA